jgi:hypothetical protein
MTAEQRTEAPIRQRRRATTAPPVQVADVLPAEVVAYMNANFGEEGMPEGDPRAMSLFIERCFSTRAYREHRHMIMDRMLRAGKTIPEIAVTFDKDERTIWTWKSEMTDYFSEAFGLMDVRELFVTRIRDFQHDLDHLDAIINKPDSTPGERIEAIRAKRLTHGMLDQVLRQAGLYRSFNVEQMRPQGARGARDSEMFLELLEDALLGDVGQIEDQTEGEADEVG